MKLKLEYTMTEEDLDQWIKGQQERPLQPYVSVMSQAQYDLLKDAEDERASVKVRPNNKLKSKLGRSSSEAIN